MSCGGGVQSRNRQCEAPQHGGEDCTGENDEKQKCNEDIICTGKCNSETFVLESLEND